MMTRILAVVVTYYPDREPLSQNIQAFVNDVDKVLVWENTPDAEKQQYRYIRHEKIEYQGDGVNSISHALNGAWRYAEENGYDYLLTMDQDSLFTDFPLYKKTVMAHCQGLSAIYGPYVEHSSRPVDPVQEREFTITSGMMLPVSTIAAVGGNDEFFAIDGLDIEFCLRARQRGIKTYVVRDCVLKQKFGDPKVVSFFGHQVSYSSYSPKRLHCMYKSQAILILTYHSEMLWKSFCLYLRKTPRNIILFEEDKLRKLWAIFSGIFEGVLYQWFHR